MLPIIASLSLLALPAPVPWEAVDLGGVESDGRAILWNVQIAKYDEPSPTEHAVALMLVTDSDGVIRKVFHESDGDTPADVPDRARGIWSAAEPYGEYRRFEQEHEFATPGVRTEPLVGEKTIAGGKIPLVLSVVRDRQRCPTLILVAKLGAIQGAVAEDPCRPGEEKSEGSFDQISVGWSPDGDRAAMSWNTVRDPPPGIAEDDWFGAHRGYMIVVSRRTLASVDLLDAGAGKRLDALADKLAQAKFRVGHRGKASTPRKKTEVYFAPGFEPEAKELAKLLGLPENAAQPLTWKTPYSLTIAAGSGG